MVDASIGGKTGVDVPGGKNLVGAFHRPAAVVTDPDLLVTLPEVEFRAGLAEVVKHGMIASEAYLTGIETALDRIRNRDADTLLHLVRDSVRIKSAIVAGDAQEAGRRAILNFGHTIGHAIEHVAAYTLPHGLAVAAGMVVESTIGELVGVTAAGTTERLIAVLARLRLPVTPPPQADPEAILGATRADKKTRATRVRYSLVTRAGHCQPDPAGGWTTDVPDTVVRQALQRRSAPVSQANTDV